MKRLLKLELASMLLWLLSIGARTRVTTSRMKIHWIWMTRLH